MTVNENTDMQATEPKNDGVTVRFTVRVRNHGTPEELRAEYEQWALSYGRDASDPVSAVDALRSLPVDDVTVTSFTIEDEAAATTNTTD